MQWQTLSEARRRLSIERGSIIKDWGGRIHIALIYPNFYTLGMSNLGFQAIYGFLNRYNQVVCERAFYEGHESISMESQRPLGDFDILAFSFPYEPDYFNAVSILKSSGIPIFAADRSEKHPLVIAGGIAVTANPAPLSAVMDCFAIGEGEAVIPRMVEVLLEGIEAPRHELLRAMGRIPGMYVPCACNSPVIRQSAMDLSGFTTASVVLTSETEFSDLYLIEIARGCSWGCPFCLAGHHSRPMRCRSIEILLEEAEQGMRHRKRLGLVSAAVSDHPQIDQLVFGLREMGAEFSVSSLRISPLSDVVLRGLAESGARTVVFAPEAGSQRLRQIVKKGLSEDAILGAVHRAAVHGFRKVKLYFMIGLPSETDDDIVAIVRLSLMAKGILDRQRMGTQLVLNVTPFVPKAGTPFQWLPMATASVLKHRLNLLKNGLSRQGVDVKADSIDWSIVQGTLSRGDSRIGQVMAKMPRMSLSGWKKAIIEAGLDHESVHREVLLREQLPWSMVHSGLETEHLRAEMERALGY